MITTGATVNALAAALYAARIDSYLGKPDATPAGTPGA